MDEENELLCVRKVGERWGTVTLPKELQDSETIVFEKEVSSGRIYVRENKSGNNVGEDR